MSTNKWAKIMAILALAGILISIFWTWVLFIVENKQAKKAYEEEVQKYYQLLQEQNSWNTEINSGEVESGNTEE